MKIRTELSEWLADFERKNHRALRVLHLGNIANNAFLNAKFMRSVGIDAEVATRDYYHIMATPEWEEEVVRGDWGDDNRPDFKTSTVGDYARPRWFMQGTIDETDEYLRARTNLENVWSALGSRKPVFEPETTSQTRGSAEDSNTNETSRHVVNNCSETASERPASSIPSRSLGDRIASRVLRTILPDPVRRGHLRGLIFGSNEAMKSQGPAAENFTLEFIKKFDDMFPDRQDRLTQEDLLPYSSLLAPLNSIFSNYDIVQAYGTDPIFPMLTSKTRYVAFEHGTLRDFIRNDNATNRLTALAYRLADHILV